MKDFLTYDQWKSRMRYVRRGEKSTFKNAEGTALFHKSQTEEWWPMYSTDVDYEYDGPGEYEYNVGWHKA